MNIILNLNQALDYIIGHKEYAIIDKDLAEQFVHESCKLIPLPNGLFKLYRIKDWLDSAEHREELKAQSSEYRSISMEQARVKDKLYDAFMAQTGHGIPREVAWALVNALIMGARVNSKGLEGYGLTKEEIAILL